MSLLNCPSCRVDVLAGAFCGNCGRPMPTPALASSGTRGPVATPPGMPPPPPHQPPANQGPPVGHPGFAAQQTGFGAAHFAQQPFPQQPFPQQPVPQQQPLRLGASGRRGPGIVVAITVLVLGAAGFAALGQGGTTHDITGQLSLYDSSAYSYKSSGSSCTGGSGYDDIQYGTQVVVTNEAGTTVATDALQSGTYDGTACTFDFTVHDVPNATYYRISAGRASRSGPQYSYDEIDQQHWSVHLSLGN